MPSSAPKQILLEMSYCQKLERKQIRGRNSEVQAGAASNLSWKAIRS
jgi:hypothetical protein